MASLETIKSMINTFKIEYEKVHKYRDKIVETIDELDFEELYKMSYEELEDTISKLRFYAKKNIIAKIQEIKNQKENSTINNYQGATI